MRIKIMEKGPKCDWKKGPRGSEKKEKRYYKPKVQIFFQI